MTLPHLLRLCSLVSFLVLFTPVVSTAQDSIVAKVGSVPITEFELDSELQRIIPLQVGPHASVPPERIGEFRGQALDRLVEKAYLVQYAIQEEVSVDFKEIEAAFNRYEERVGAGDKLKEALGGTSVQTLRAAIYRDLLAGKVAKMIGEKAKVKDEDLRRHFEQAPALLERPTKLRASVIFIPVDPAKTAEEQETLKIKAEDLAKQARAGEDFYNLAYYNSNHRSKYVGGDLGYFQEGQLQNKEIERALLRLKPGEIAGPIRDKEGYHIFKLTELEQTRRLSFDEAKAEIAPAMEKEMKEKLFKKLMADLKAKYPVTIIDPALSAGAKK